MLSRIGPIYIPHCQDFHGVGLFHMGDRTNSSGTGGGTRTHRTMSLNHVAIPVRLRPHL